MQSTLTSDIKYLRLAQSVADIFSKDPSTRVGAVVVGQQKNQVAFGYNGMPPGLADTTERLENRAVKLSLTLHAEINALANASFTPHTLYVTHHPCSNCALHIMARRLVKRVVYLTNLAFETRWADSLTVTRSLFAEAGIELQGVVL